jgi:hypothetical protein
MTSGSWSCTSLARGTSGSDLDATKNYFTKHVYLVTAPQNRELGDRLDANRYGVRDFPTYMCEALARVTLADVNVAIHVTFPGTTCTRHLHERRFRTCRTGSGRHASTVTHHPPKTPACLARRGNRRG